MEGDGLFRYSKEYEDVLKRRKQAQDYLEHCVPVANVTREFREKVRV